MSSVLMLGHEATNTIAVKHALRERAQWSQCYIPGRKAETLGKLRIIVIEETQA